MLFGRSLGTQITFFVRDVDLEAFEIFEAENISRDQASYDQRTSPHQRLTSRVSYSVHLDMKIPNSTSIDFVP